MESPALHGGAESVNVKSEPCEDVYTTEESLCEELSVNVEPLLDVSVKIEPCGENGLIEPEPSCSKVKEELVGVSAAAAAAGLYAGHAVKDELVLGPMLVERRGARHALKGQTEKTTSAGTPNTLNCDHCRYATARKQYLIWHLRKHSYDKPYKCNQCSYASNRRRDLQAHERLHTGERPYQCSQCSYASARKRDLQLHKSQHSGEKPYQCSQCSYASNRRRDLQAHERLHTGERPYRCSQCSYVSARKYHLRVHEKKHTGEKSYRCDQCSYASARKDNLRVHERQHTSE